MMLTREILCGWQRMKDCARAIRLTLVITLIVAAQATGEVLMRPAAGYGNLPLSFERNVGQSHPEVQFLARGQGYTLFLTANEAVLALRGKQESGARSQKSEAGIRAATARERTRYDSEVRTKKIAGNDAVLRMELVGANPAANVAGMEELPGKSNYLIGNDPKQWRTNVPTYAKVRYEAIYPGVDLVYYGKPAPMPHRGQRQLEHDFIIAPGANPRSIRVRLAGAERVSLEGNGDLRVRLAGHELCLLRPVIYQREGGERKEIAGGYVLRALNEVGFSVGAYDMSKPLVIDPLVLFYSSFLGGLGGDEGNAIAVDSGGNAYVTGETGSTNFPLRGAIQTTPTAFQDTDAFVTKVSPAGAIVYSTYLKGSATESGFAIAVDASGAAYVAGETDSPNFPVQNAAQATHGSPTLGTDAFVAKLNPAGSALVYSTFLGGTNEDTAYGIAVDAQGNAYVTGETHAPNFPTLNPFQRDFCCPDDPRFGNAFVTKYNATGSLAYSTHLGGGGTGGSGIAVDAAGNAYVTGITNSEKFPTTAGAFQREMCCVMVFVTKLNPQGNGLVYSTFVGGWGGPIQFGRGGIAVDSAGNAYVTGRTGDPNFPTTANAFQRTLGSLTAFTDAFVTKLNPSGSALAYSTFLGGNNDDEGRAIAVDSVGDAYVTGFTRSSNFPVAGAAQQTFGGGSCAQAGQPAAPCSDIFLTELNPSGTALVVSTFFGGNNEDEGHGIAVDAIGYPHITGLTRSRNFPTRNPLQAQIGDDPGNPSSDAFITKMIEPPIINPGGTVNAASLAAGGAVAPGSIVSVFGTKFATESHATAVPLPTTLPPPPDPRGVSLRFNTTLAIPLFDTFAAQINFQIPWELEGQASASITATASGLTSDSVPVALTTYAPGIFSTTASGRGQGAILISATGEVAAPAGSIPGRATRPAQPGEFLTIFCTGLGPVTNRPATGAIAPSAPLATTTATPTVTIGGQTIVPSFSGLSPGFVGLYQVNVQTPSGVAGNDVPVVITIGGVASNTVTIAVQQ